ncbi:hypothetical protein HY630_02195 [Candidatus Uhrbacteria bacterium]|nr:hypothetical protein [Candidatus Uhrbacteria bacterium]
MDFNDYPQQKSLPWKPIALIAGGVVLGIVVVFVVVRLIQSARQEDVVIQNGSAQMREEFTRCEESADPDACRDGLVKDLAQSEGSVEMCDLLETQESQDNCYWSVARTTQEAAACSGISVTAYAQRCADDVALATAVESQDIQRCEGIVDERREEQCVERILGPLTSENCQGRHPERCEDIGLLEQAKESRETAYCLEIVDESMAISCVDAVEDLIEAQGDIQPIEESDTDDDGLQDLDELLTYGSDPLNPDTDGDGYLDGAEVAAGYDPNGSGRLEE